MIRISMNGHSALVAPKQYLGGLFNTYVGVCRDAGAKYDKAENASRIAVLRVPELVEALGRVGLHVEVDDDVRAALHSHRATADAESNEAAGRAAVIDSALRAAGSELYKYQQDGVRWLAPRYAAGLFDQMGLGKTIQALVAAPAGAPVLVVCPKNAKGVWVREAAKWRPELNPVTLKGRTSFRWPAPGEMIVINYDILAQDPGDAPEGVVVIADEAHKLKTSKASRTVRFRALSRSARAAGGRVWLLTGTPLLNRPGELWSVLAAADLSGDAFGSWNRFVPMMGGRKGRFGMEWSGQVDPQVPELLRRVSLLRRREDVLPDLPTKTYETVEFECVPQDLRRICDEIVAAIRKRGLDLEDAIAEAIETKAGVVFEAVSRVRSMLAASKIPALLEWLEQFEEAEEPVIVFSRHRAPIDAIATRPGWGTITGDQSAEQRSRVEEAFQAGRLVGVCATIQAGCEALTLTRACRVVFVDLDWTPALNQQAEDRVCRIGQTRGVIVTRIIADHELDARVIELLGKKQSLIEQSVEASAVVTPVAVSQVELPPAGNAEHRPADGVKIATQRSMRQCAGGSP